MITNQQTPFRQAREPSVGHNEMIPDGNPKVQAGPDELPSDLDTGAAGLDMSRGVTVSERDGLCVGKGG